MANFFMDNDDLRWYIEHGIDWAPLVRLTEYDFRAEDAPESLDEALGGYRDILDAVGHFVAEEIAPHWQTLDRDEPRMVDGEVKMPDVFDGIFEQIRDMGLHGLSVPRELGGTNAPIMLFSIVLELMARADVSVCAHHGFHGGMALAGLSYSLSEGTTSFQTDPPRLLDTRFRQAIDELVSGEAWGSMDITEPDAGSDMAAMRTWGEQDDDGQWFVSGTKIFITSGHGKWHYVIARTEEPQGDDALAGLQGLSMFLVPAYSDADDGKRTCRCTSTGRPPSCSGSAAKASSRCCC